ncbi:hypothetical protein B0H17DRAFT_1211605 [Mycena rosella]|uniref:Uncharacterized protein n=1 Tax=Mycena rosella TaxID=1033263 RepID=A0AAD7G3F7_MYCRO|nr:hypothetical protein B0H17DRAFT_1211605 [Mycena rosella]
MPDPIAQALAHVAQPLYKDFGSDLYTVVRVVHAFDQELQREVDRLEIKAGYSVDTARRQLEYHENCTGNTSCICRSEREAPPSSRALVQDAPSDIFWLGALGQPIDRIEIPPVP